MVYVISIRSGVISFHNHVQLCSSQIHVVPSQGHVYLVCIVKKCVELFGDCNCLLNLNGKFIQRRPTIRGGRVLADPREGVPRTLPESSPSESNFFHFHAVLRKILAK